MPTYDHRVFKSGEQWWIAEVHVASGSVDKNGARTMHREEVLFTCLTELSLMSRKAEIQSGQLNRFRHTAIQQLLESAEELDKRFEMHPYNAPPEPMDNEAVFVDPDGTRWILRPSALASYKDHEPLNAVEIICMDDSAIKRKIGMADKFTFSDFVSTWGSEAKNQLIGLVHQQYDELPDRRETRRRRVTSLGINPLDIIADESKVTFGSKKLPQSFPIVFAAPDIKYEGEMHTVNTGIIRGYVFAGTEPRNPILESAIIKAIENHPEHAFLLRMVRANLSKLDG